jgi:group II intron reverse transcriptase/maturase
MARQKSENRELPQSRRKAESTRSDEPPGGGKTVPVNQRAEQLLLPFGSAENPESKDPGPVGGVDRSRKRSVSRAGRKPKVKEQQAKLASMEVVADYLELAFEKVAANKGAPGPDRQTIDQVRKRLGTIMPRLRRSLLDGSYQPGDIRRVWIPKSGSGGGQRGLGIPNVVDRVVQEAVRMVLEPLYEPTFHEQSHGFRPGRGCHTAITQAQQYLDEGYEWLVDLDLEKFFDRVNHQRLQARLAQAVIDKRLLALIGRMLKAAVVMPDGVRVSTEEGVPQGGPLSPLLSNIVLDELDQELSRRGHRFVRYADDCNIYVRSERAGQRVMSSVVQFIERRLRLKVNMNKSAVARPETRHFLGFRLSRHSVEDEVEILLSKRSEERLKEKVRDLTPRTWGRSVDECIAEINAYLNGWLGHFGICTNGVLEHVSATDAHIRRRLRAIQLRHWKRKKTIVRRLIKLGVSPVAAQGSLTKGRRGWWRLSHTIGVDHGMTVAYWTARGLKSLATHWEKRTPSNRNASRQLTLPWK